MPANRLFPLRSAGIVPWRGVELIAIIAVFVTAQAIAVSTVDWQTDDDLEESASTESAEFPQASPFGKEETPEQNPHPVVLLLANNSSWWVITVCILAAVVVAPVVEEFIFRVLFQGWLERLETTLRTPPVPPRDPSEPTKARSDADDDVLNASAPLPEYHNPDTTPQPTSQLIDPHERSSAHSAPPTYRTILISAALFSLIHFRVGETETILPLHLVASSASSLVTLLVGALLLTRFAGATTEDLGLSFRHAIGDCGLGIVAFFAIAPIVYAIQVIGVLTLPNDVAADPIALFPFAIVLGYLYQRTHRALPSIVAHLCLNAFSIGMVWLQFSSAS